MARCPRCGGGVDARAHCGQCGWDEDPFKPVLLEIYDGPTPFTGLLREALRMRGIGSMSQGIEPLMGILGEAAQPPFSRVLISSRDWVLAQDDVVECLSFVTAEVVPENEDED